MLDCWSIFYQGVLEVLLVTPGPPGLVRNPLVSGRNLTERKLRVNLWQPKSGTFEIHILKCHKFRCTFREIRAVHYDKYRYKRSRTNQLIQQIALNKIVSLPVRKCWPPLFSRLLPNFPSLCNYPLIISLIICLIIPFSGNSKPCQSIQKDKYQRLIWFSIFTIY